MDGLAIDTKTGLAYRVGSNDLATIREMRRAYGKLRMGPGSVVLDVGACFGSFTSVALDAGARVIAYEPLLANFTLLRQNCPEADCRNAALIVGDAREVELYWTGRVNYWTMHSTAMTRRKFHATVPAEDFHTVLAEVRPDVIKMDIEGGEYELLAEPLPGWVRQLALEMHTVSNRVGVKRELAAHLAAQFSTTVVAPRVDTGAWNLVGVYSR